MDELISMNDKIDKFRFFVIDDGDKPRSSVWFITCKKDSVYISDKAIGGSIKLSIHPDDLSSDGKNCQVGFVGDYAKRMKAVGYDVLKPIRWLRPMTPEKGVVCVVSIMFPTDYLKANIIEKLHNLDSKKKWKFALPIAKAGHAVSVDVFYTKENPGILVEEFKKINFTVLGYITLSSAEFVIITARHVLFDSKMIPDLGSRHGNPLEGAPSAGQSIENMHAIMWTEPKDGSIILLSEINGLVVTNKAGK